MWLDVREIFERLGFEIRTINGINQSIMNLHSRIDPEIVFLLRLFAICKMLVLLSVVCYMLGVNTIMQTILVMSLISILCTSFSV